jgi:hypothetical protein
MRSVLRSALVLFTLASATPVIALEPGAHPPFLAGSTGGIPIGALPPPALYASSLTTYAEGLFHPDDRPNARHPRSLHAISEGLTFLWVPDITLLGARYGAFVQQTYVFKNVTDLPPRGQTHDEDGLNNLLISPLNLAWKLPSDFFVSARFGVHLLTGQYDRHDQVYIANNFWTFEPNVGISYLRGGFDVSLHLLYDIMTENTSSSAPGNLHSRYHSGNIFTADYSVSQAFGNWRFGMTGWGVKQTHPDSGGGRTLHGTGLSRVGLGPLVEYNTKWVGVNLYYVHDINWRGGFGGDNFFLRASFKF